MKKLVSILLLAAFSLFTGTALATVLQVPVLAVATPLFAASAINFFYMQANPNAFHGTMNMAIAQEFWVNYIINNLFKQNPHLERCFKEDDYVLGGSVVHIPQAGAKPTAVKNRSSFPATIISRTDTDITYPLDLYDVPPTVIRDAEQAELSYNKMDSVYGEQVAALREIIGDDILFKWSAEALASMVRTTGGAVAAHLDSATGNRKLFTSNDLKKARTLMNKQNIPKEDRYCLLSSELLDQLQSDTTLQARDFGGELDFKNGVIARLWGFEILERSSVLRYTDATTPVRVAIDAAGAAAHNDSALCWQKNALASAMGDVKFFEDLKNPEHYGDIYSANVRMGGRKRRTNAEGVIQIIQAASA